jgi:hypothetical protein
MGPPEAAAGLLHVLRSHQMGRRYVGGLRIGCRPGRRGGGRWTRRASGTCSSSPGREERRPQPRRSSFGSGSFCRPLTSGQEGCLPPSSEMEFLNSIFSRGFWAYSRVFSDSSFWYGFLPSFFPVYRMLFMNRLEFSCFADVFVCILNYF